MIDDRVNQTAGVPLLVITGPKREGLVRQLRTVLKALDKQDYPPRQLPGTTQPCPQSHQAYIEALTKDLDAKRARRAALPGRVPFADTASVARWLGQAKLHPWSQVSSAGIAKTPPFLEPCLPHEG
jgi:hypothetical protein